MAFLAIRAHLAALHQHNVAYGIGQDFPSTGPTRLYNIAQVLIIRAGVAKAQSRRWTTLPRQRGKSACRRLEKCQPQYRIAHLSMATSWLSLARQNEVMDDVLASCETARVAWTPAIG